MGDREVCIKVGLVFAEKMVNTCVATGVFILGESCTYKEEIFTKYSLFSFQSTSVTFSDQ